MSVGVVVDPTSGFVGLPVTVIGMARNAGEYWGTTSAAFLTTATRLNGGTFSVVVTLPEGTLV